MTARVSMLKSRASPDMLPFTLCNKKRLAIRHMNRPLFNDTIDSVLRHREVGRAKDLSAPSRKSIHKIENSFIKFVHTFAWTNSAPTGLISIKFYVSTFFVNLSREFKFHSTVTGTTALYRTPMHISDHISLSCS